MSVLEMPPLAVVLDPSGTQMLVVRLGEFELGTARVYDVGVIWHAKQSAN
jgi:hypothetical protein